MNPVFAQFDIKHCAKRPAMGQSVIKLKMIYLVISLLVNFVNSEMDLGINDLEGMLYNLTHPESFVFYTKCIKGVGCFYNGPPWFDLQKRPFSPSPSDVKDITYSLYTPQNPKESYMMNISKRSVQNSPFDPNLPTEVMIHGAVADASSYQVVLDMKDSVLKVGNYNVIVPDFKKYVQQPYFQAVANARVAAARIAKLLQKIMNVTEAKAESFHLSGYSLGAQVCAYIGKIIPNIGRITALSAAGPYFDGTAEETRLIPSDALFVDAIHTNGHEGIDFNGLGSLQQWGHQDFYVNGGVRQPGCIPDFVPPLLEPQKAANYSAQFVQTLCDHARANMLYQESITSKNCSFRAVKCNSFDDFQAGKCPPDSSTVALMGFPAKTISNENSPAKFYLRTNESKPYCINDSAIPKQKYEGLLTKFLKIFF